MTITVQDAIEVGNLSPGYGGYVGYTDGDWPTIDAVHARFPAAPTLALTTGLGDAEGIDCEPGNVSWDDNQAAVPGWLSGRLAAGVWRPAVYIGSSYAGALLARLPAAGVARADIRLFTAHWTGIPHICTSATCDPRSPVEWAADGTQYAGNIGDRYDLSLVADDFFAPTATTVATTTATASEEDDMPNKSVLIVTAKVPATKRTLPGDLFAVSGLSKLPISLDLAVDWANELGQVLPGEPGSLQWTCSELDEIPNA